MLKIHQRKNKICWLHVQWDAPTSKCAHSAGRLCRNCFANASTGTRPHSPPFPEQLRVSLLHLCKSQRMNTSWVHSHKHAELLLQRLSCSLQQRPQTKTKSTRSTVQSSAVESKSTLNCSLQNNNGKKYNKKKSIRLRLHTYAHARIRHMCALAGSQSERACTGRTEAPQAVWVFMGEHESLFDGKNIKSP